MNKFAIVTTLVVLAGAAYATGGFSEAVKVYGNHRHHAVAHHVVKAAPAYGYAGDARQLNHDLRAGSGSCVNGGFTSWGYVGCDPDPRIQFELQRDPSWLRSRS